jgi:hypothetical protein
MAERAEVVFNEAVAYERFIATGAAPPARFFLDWVIPPRGARWMLL